MAKSKRIIDDITETFDYEPDHDGTISILDVRPGQSIRGYRDNPVRYITTDHDMSCRGVHVNDNACFDRIARVVLDMPKAFMEIAEFVSQFSVME